MIFSEKRTSSKQKCSVEYLKLFDLYTIWLNPVIQVKLVLFVYYLKWIYIYILRMLLSKNFKSNDKINVRILQLL